MLIINTMKQLLFAILLFFAGCTFLTSNGVEQQISEDPKPCLLCPSGRCLWTYVWFKGDIVWSRYDDINTITDSLVECRKAQAKNVYNALKKLKN